MNSILKQKMHKGSSIKLRKLYYTKARNKKNSIKVLQEVMRFLEKHDYDKYGFKKEKTQTHDRHN